MRILLDTNILTRLVEPTHPHHLFAKNAIHKLASASDEMLIVPQVIYEFWVVATRPIEQNGLGFDWNAAQSELATMESLFPVLNDTPAVFTAWKALIARHHVIGKPAHDTRLVAAMNVHGLVELMSFNKSDFARYPEIRARAPQDLLATANP